MAITLQTAEKEYEKNPSIKKDDIAILKDWADRQPHLPKLTDVNLISFYHSCYNRMELTKSTIDLNLTLRTHIEFFLDRDPSAARNADCLKTALYAILPQLSPEGYKVVYCRLMDYDVSHFSLENCIKGLLMVTDMCQMEEGTFEGCVILIDLDRVTFGHLAKLHIMTIRSILMYLQDAMPVRLKGFHFMNTPSFMDKILALMRPFMKKNFIDMLHLHPTPKTAFEMVPQEIFPKDLGGKCGSFVELQALAKEKAKINRQLLIDQEKLKVDETRRPGKPKDLGTIFGVEGSFKKLDID